MVVASLEKTDKRGWEAVKSIKTCKRLDDEQLTAIDDQVLWSRSSSDNSSSVLPWYLFLSVALVLFQLILVIVNTML